MNTLETWWEDVFVPRKDARGFYLEVIVKKIYLSNREEPD